MIDIRNFKNLNHDLIRTQFNVRRRVFLNCVTTSSLDSPFLITVLVTVSEISRKSLIACMLNVLNCLHRGSQLGNFEAVRTKFDKIPLGALSF